MCITQGLLSATTGSCILSSIIIPSFDFNLSKSLISRGKKKITSHYVSGLCLTRLESISLSQKVDLHSLLDLICQSMINKYLAVSFLFARSYMLVDLHTISEEIFSLIELHGTQKKCGVNLTTTKLKYKEIRISYLKYFKISLQISNFRRILTQAEFQCVYTK